MRVNQLEQFNNAARGNLQAFMLVEPDALTGETEIEDDFTTRFARKAVFPHRLVAGRAGRRFHTESHEWARRALFCDYTAAWGVVCGEPGKAAKIGCLQRAAGI